MPWMIEVLREPSKRATLICDSSFSALSQYKFLESQSKARPRQFTMSVKQEHSAEPHPSQADLYNARRPLVVHKGGTLTFKRQVLLSFIYIFYLGGFCISLRPVLGNVTQRRNSSNANQVTTWEFCNIIISNVLQYISNYWKSNINSVMFYLVMRYTQHLPEEMMVSSWVPLMKARLMVCVLTSAQ